MPKHKEDKYKGMKLNYLTLIKRVEDRITVSAAGNKNIAIYYECKCDCGNTCELNFNSVIRGRTISCGRAGKFHSARGLFNEVRKHEFVAPIRSGALYIGVSSSFKNKKRTLKKAKNGKKIT